MALAWIDWLLVLAYFAITIGISVYYYKIASKDTGEYFLSGRNMPWWLAGTSMVAAAFAADTPLAVAELVAEEGVAGNWLWWNMLMGGMLTVFFFARLWRRSGVLTDVEFVEFRYSGKPAAWLRGIKALYFGLLFNAIILGWVTLAMETIIEVLFPGITVFGYESFMVLGTEISAALVICGGLIIIVALYTLLAGLYGVVIAGFFQFIIALVGTILLAILALRVPEVGGMSGLLDQLPEETFRFTPSLGQTAQGAVVLTLSWAAFIGYIGVQWWASWYPGNEPGGGGYIAQRMMSAKDEKHSLFSTLWFNVAHYCLRPWPWIITALVALVLYPDLDNPRHGFVMVMRDVLPPGMLGLLFAAFLAAFMSTFSTQINWGTSYIINDFWRRFLKSDGSERYYVFISRIVTFVLALFSFIITTQLDAIFEAWQILLTASGGLGLVLIIRWYWWRVNAWSELTATLVPIFMAVLYAFGVPVPGLEHDFPVSLFYIVAITTAAWLLVTFLTQPDSNELLDKFYRKVRPGGPGWKPFRDRHPDVEPDSNLGSLFVNWILGVAMVYLILFGIGHLLFLRPLYGILCLAGAALAVGYLYWDLSHRGFDVVLEQDDTENSDESDEENKQSDT